MKNNYVCGGNHLLVFVSIAVRLVCLFFSSFFIFISVWGIRRQNMFQLVDKRPVSLDRVKREEPCSICHQIYSITGPSMWIVLAVLPFVSSSVPDRTNPWHEGVRFWQENGRCLCETRDYGWHTYRIDGIHVLHIKNVLNTVYVRQYMSRDENRKRTGSGKTI